MGSVHGDSLNFKPGVEKFFAGNYVINFLQNIFQLLTSSYTLYSNIKPVVLMYSEQQFKKLLTSFKNWESDQKGNFNVKNNGSLFWSN